MRIIRIVSLWILTLMVPALATAQDSVSFRVAGWNLESGESDMDLIREQMAAKKGISIWGLSEVPKSGAVAKLESGAEDGENADFQVVFGSTGGDDRMAILFDSGRFDLVGKPEELKFIQLTAGLRAPLVARLKGRKTGKEFLFMVNHLKRGGAQNPTRIKQAKLLNQWAKSQSVPIIAVGDYNFDYDVEFGDAGFPHRDQGFDEMTRDGVFVYLRPEMLVKTNADDDFNSVLDFVFVAHAPFGWNAESRILDREGDSVATDNDFDDDARESDHRSVDAIFTVDSAPPEVAVTARVLGGANQPSREEILQRIERLESELRELRRMLR